MHLMTLLGIVAPKYAQGNSHAAGRGGEHTRGTAARGKERERSGEERRGGEGDERGALGTQQRTTERGGAAEGQEEGGAARELPATSRGNLNEATIPFYDYDKNPLSCFRTVPRPRGHDNS